MNDGTVVVVEHDQKFDLVAQSANDVMIRSRKLATAIKDQASFEAASEYRKMINGFKKAAIDDLDKIKKPAYATYKAILDKINEVIGPFDGAMGILDAPLGAWWDQQERARKAEEARLQAEAKRLQDEAQLNAAIAAEQSGNEAKAEAIMDRPTVVPAVQLPKTQATKGVGFTKLYGVKVETIDMKVLIAAVVARKAPEQALIPNITFLNGQARLMKESFNVPGVELSVQTNVSSRSK